MYTRKKVISIGIASLCLALVQVGTANAVSLALEAPSTIIAQQTTQNPCIFGDPSCNNPADFDYTLFPAGGSLTEYADQMSPVYTVDQLIGVASSTAFDIGIDVNTAAGASGPEILEYFYVLVNGVIEFSFVNGVDGDGTLGYVNNGTGFSDSRLIGIDLSGFALTDLVQFKTTISRTTDGRENLFIIAADSPTVVPEPATALLLLPGLMFARRRKQ